MVHNCKTSKLLTEPDLKWYESKSYKKTNLF